MSTTTVLKKFAQLSLIAALGIGVWLSVPLLHAGEGAVQIPVAAADNPKAAGALQTAVLSGGCFWGVQGVFEHMKGVRKVLAGYAGGAPSTAEYETVSTGTTGHAESVQITFDPALVSYGEILRVFFSVVHDPTELNRQGPDVGTQYRSNIFYMDDAQKNVAQAYIEQLNSAKVFSHPIVTRIDPYRGFYPAEAYHQDYLIRNPQQPYIAYVDLPKLKNFQQMLPEYYQGQPVMVSSAASH
jgi:peptide-methionine (S)-S-oxide reductase